MALGKSFVTLNGVAIQNQQKVKVLNLKFALNYCKKRTKNTKKPPDPQKLSPKLN